MSEDTIYHLVTHGQLQPDSILHPVTKEIIDPDDVDGLCDALQLLNEARGTLYAMTDQVRDALVALSKPNKTKTRYVAGETRKAKIVERPLEFHQTDLKNLVNNRPDLASHYIRPSTYAVNRVAYDELQRTETKDEKLLSFKAAFKKAEKFGGSFTVTVHDRVDTA